MYGPIILVILIGGILLIWWAIFSVALADTAPGPAEKKPDEAPPLEVQPRNIQAEILDLSRQLDAVTTEKQARFLLSRMKAYRNVMRVARSSKVLAPREKAMQAIDEALIDMDALIARAERRVGAFAKSRAEKRK